MKMEIIAVGNEAQYRNHFDTAYQYLKKETAILQAEPSYRILRQEPTALFAALKESMQNHEVTLLLLPPEPAAAETLCKVLCNGLDRPPVVDAALEGLVGTLAERSGRSLTYEERAAFATFPQGATVLRNTAGLVQGYVISARKQMVLVLPTFPSELVPLYSAGVRPLLGKFAGLSVSYGTVRVLELDQFSVEQELNRLNQNPNLHVSQSNNHGDYEIYLEALGATQSAADDLKNNAIKRLREQFGIYLYCIGSRELPDIVTDGLARNALTLSVAEWGTGSLMDQELSAAWGSGNYYTMHFDEGTIRSEMHLPHRIMQEAEEGSASFASILAVQSRRTGHTALGLGICCNSASGQIFVALADRSRVWHRRLEMPADRTADTVRTAVWQAFNVLRLYTAQYPTPLPGGTEAKEIEKKLGGLPSLFSSHSKKAAPPAAREKESETMKNSSPSKQNRQGPLRRKAPTAAAAAAAEAPAGTNLIQRLKHRQLTAGDRKRLIALGLCFIVFIGCIIYIASVKLESLTNAKKTQDIANLYGADIDVDDYPSEYLPKFKALYAENPDIAGWISLPDTKLNYAVMQAENNEKYSRTDFYLKDNQHGIPFVDFRVDLAKPSYNTIIYAHNMGDGQMFGELIKYKQISYYREHPIVQFDSLYREDTYKIFAVVLARADDPDFSYHNFIDSTEEKARNDFLADIKARTLVKTTVDVTADDRILTLSTCDYSFRDTKTGDHIARLVIFARAIRDGENAAVNTAGATLNPNPLMPEEWYKYLVQQQEKKAAAELEAEQKAFIALWLTEEEQQQSYTTEELYLQAQERAELAERCLTTTELMELTAEDGSHDVAEMLSLIHERQKLFRLLLDSGESAGTNVENKLALCKERSDLLGQKWGDTPLFTETELANAGNWNKLAKLYQFLAAEGNSTKDSNGEWAPSAELQRYMSRSDLLGDLSADPAVLMAQRKAEAAKYLSASQINGCTDWSTLSSKIDTAKGTRADLEKKAAELGIADYQSMTMEQLSAAITKKQNEVKFAETIEKIRTLNPGATVNNTKLEDVTDLEALTNLLTTLQNERSSLEQQGKATGMTDDELAACKTNAELKTAVDAKKAAKEAADKAVLITAIKEMAGNTKNDTELGAMTLDQLTAYQAELAQRAQEQQEKDALITELKSKGVTDDMSGWTLEQLKAKKAELDASQQENPPEENSAE